MSEGLWCLGLSPWECRDSGFSSASSLTPVVWSLRSLLWGLLWVFFVFILTVSGKFFTDNLGRSLLLWGIFPFLTALTKQKQYLRSRENFSPCNFTRAIPQGKKEKLPLSLQMLLHQKKLLKTSPADSKRPVIHVYFNILSFHYEVFPVLSCSNYKRTCLLYWDTTWGDNLLFQVYI